MKKILSTILPSLLIFTFICYDHFIRGEESLTLLLGIFILFPIIFILQGIVCLDSKNSMIIGFLLSSIAVMLPISIWYGVAGMAGMSLLVIVYLLLVLIPSFFSNIIKRKFITKE